MLDVLDKFVNKSSLFLKIRHSSRFQAFRFEDTNAMTKNMVSKAEIIPSITIKAEPEESVHRVCRLCLSEESLDEILRDADLIQWISDFLSIMITREDRISQSICAICRIRLTEFYQFRMHCQEVQDVLNSMLRPNDVDHSQNSDNHRNTEEKISYETKNDTQDHKGEKSAATSTEAEHPSCDVDIIDIGEVKMETDLGDEFKGSSELSVEQPTSINEDSSNTIEAKEMPVTNSSECNICFKVFKSRKLLWQHNMITHAPKKFVCHDCGVGFPFRSNLLQHLHSIKHSMLSKVDSKEDQKADDVVRRKWPCDVCPKFFPSVIKLINHQRYHQSMKKHLCSICGKAFVNSTRLEKHMALKHKQDAYNCTVCEQSFRTSGFLQRHYHSDKHKNLSKIVPIEIT